MRDRQNVGGRPVARWALSRKGQIAAFVALAGCCQIGLAATVSAESLIDAWSKAYQSNPTIQAQRAQLRATDEGVAQALSGWRPTVQAGASVGRIESDTNDAALSGGSRNPASVNLQINQPIYRGGRTVAATSRAENDVQAQRAQLLNVEQQVLLDVSIAYMAVLRDQAVLDLNLNNEKVLQRQLDAAQDRFSVGEVTRTDVSQAEAARAGATADRVQAAGNLAVSRANYERLVGELPGQLTQPPAVPNVPTSKEAAIEAARARNPNVLFAAFNELSARDNVRFVEGELYPTVDLNGVVARDWEGSRRDSRVDDARVTADLIVPLYQAGAVSSRVREAKQVASLRRIQIDEARRLAVEEATQAWETLETARARITSLSSEIEASEIALDGVQQEALVGTRTVLDVLDAEQDLLNARVNLVVSQRDVAVAVFTLAAAAGVLTAEQLDLPVDYYNMDKHFRGVRNQWWGTGTEVIQPSDVIEVSR